MISNNGTGKEEEIVLKLSPAIAVKVSDIAYSLNVVQQLMQKIMEQHQSLCSFQQSQMDALLVMLCEAEGKKLPHRYEYKLNLEELVISIRAQDDQLFAPPQST